MFFLKRNFEFLHLTNFVKCKKFKYSLQKNYNVFSPFDMSPIPGSI